jgi:hypothetical protein
MSGDNCFRIWRKGMGLSQVHAALALGYDIRTIQRYDTCKPDHFPFVASYAALMLMWACAHGIWLTPWPADPQFTQTFDLRRRFLGSQFIAQFVAWQSETNQSNTDSDLYPIRWHGKTSMERPANSNWFRVWREGTGLTQADAARLFCCYIRTVQRYDAGGHYPSLPLRRVMFGVALGIEFESWPVDSSEIPEIVAKIAAWKSAVEGRRLGDEDPPSTIRRGPSDDGRPNPVNALTSDGRARRDIDKMEATNCRGPFVDDKLPSTNCYRPPAEDSSRPTNFYPPHADDIPFPEKGPSRTIGRHVESAPTDSCRPLADDNSSPTNARRAKPFWRRWFTT